MEWKVLVRGPLDPKTDPKTIHYTILLNNKHYSMEQIFSVVLPTIDFFFDWTFEQYEKGIAKIPQDV